MYLLLLYFAIKNYLHFGARTSRVDTKHIHHWAPQSLQPMLKFSLYNASKSLTS